jgi:DNA helicase-2/ATP-dependent DNA helicase PcrA
MEELPNPEAAAAVDDLLQDLNPRQREAVEAPDGPLLIFAGAGSGKTRVLTHRIAHLIRTERALPYQILAVTFTNKAAREMRSRLEALFQLSAAGIWMGTFHAMSVRLLRREAEAAGLSRNFQIYDEVDRLGVVRRVMKDLRIDEKRYPPASIVHAISQAKNELRSPAEHAKTVGSYFADAVSRVYLRYEAYLAANEGLDFDDLILRAVRLLDEVPQVREHYQQRFHHVLVDEYQDTNHAQYVLVKRLAEKHRNLCVVGDDDQSIYGWRGADVRNILSFEKDYPDARVVMLEQNYRSTQTILDVAHHVIRSNPDRAAKRLWTEKGRGERVMVAQLYDEQEEALAVASEIQALVNRGAAGLADIAVLFRTNAQSRAVEEALLRRSIPYKLVGGVQFYERREVKDTLAYLRLVSNPQDGASLGRVINVPRRKIGDKTLAALETFAATRHCSLWDALPRAAEIPGIVPAAAHALMSFHVLISELQALSEQEPVDELLDQVMLRTGYRALIQDGTPPGEERWQNLMELRGLASEYSGLPPREGLQAFLEDAALISDVDTLDEHAPGVTLITLHMVKGLEFPVVFLLGMEEGLFPHRRAFDDPRGLEEERRLCYVGITRAKERLYFFHTFRRHLYGTATLNIPSRFLTDIPPELVRSAPGLPAGRTGERLPAGYDAIAPAAELAPLTQRFQAGDRIQHRSFGRGQVLKSTLTRTDEELIVRFETAGVKILAVSVAPLTKLPA